MRVSYLLLWRALWSPPPSQQRTSSSRRFARGREEQSQVADPRLYGRALRAGPCAGRRTGGVQLRPDRAQGDRYARHRTYFILEVSSGVLNHIFEFISKLTLYQYIALEIVFCLVDFGTIALLIVLRQTYQETPVGEIILFTGFHTPRARRHRAFTTRSTPQDGGQNFLARPADRNWAASGRCF